LNSEDDSFAAILRRVAFDELDREAGRGRARLHLPRSWSQGRSTFGGLQAALVLEGMAALVVNEDSAPARRARSLQIAFVGPTTSEAVLEVERLRHGRSATVVRATILGDEAVTGFSSGRGDSTREICTSAIGCFAAARDSKLELPGTTCPELRGPDGLISLPHIEGVTPNFARHFELRWATGGPPGSGIRSGEFSGWVRAREHAMGPGATWIAALVDAWPAPTLQMTRAKIPASSLGWTIDFIDEDADAATDQWWPFVVETDRSAEGWSHTRARLWSPNGKLVASSSQLVAVFG
jgi:acyl-CoA thioesterase